VNNNIFLKGITWAHSRGYTPLAAASQRFSELNPGIEISWKKRSLQGFADHPVEQLAKEYDLLIIDHPWVGSAAHTKCILPLEQYLPSTYLNEQRINSVGESYGSYSYESHQWALPIDAAAPVASYRKDLLALNDYRVPSTWEEMLILAKQGRVAVPGIPVDLLMNFYMFCIAFGNEPFTNTDKITDTETSLHALNTMRSLWSLTDPIMFTCNPIRVAELMSSTNDYWYCPFSYGYSNYSRDGYAKYVLDYCDLVEFGSTGLLKSTLGGTGIAISSSSTYQDEALAFASWVAAPQVQSTLYAQNGGQPGNLKAWENPLVNNITNNYFINTLPALQRSYLRPRYNGYLFFQDKAGIILQQYLQKGGNPDAVLEKLNSCYRQSIGADQPA
jgi:multiple sugar transport system substrate-binding protein